MITVHESDTGEYVLRHEATGMVIVDPDIERAYKRLREHLAESHPEDDADNGAPEIVGAPAPASRSIAWIVAVLLLAAILIPFVWMHATAYVDSTQSAQLERHITRQQNQIDDMKRLLDDMTIRVNDIHLRLNALDAGTPKKP